MSPPYIDNSEGRREELSFHCDLQHFDNPINAGEFNFFITKAMQIYFEMNGQNYQAWNDISGAIEEAKCEFRRRVIFDYENLKIKQNGDCY